MQENTEKFILPPYVSGFYKDGGRTPEKVSLSIFRDACEKLAHGVGWELKRVLDFSGQPSRSYHLAVFAAGDAHERLVLCNKYYPIVAFAKVVQPSADGHSFDYEKGMPENEYIEPGEGGQFFTPRFTALDKAYLAVTVDADNPSDAVVVSKLSDYEFAEFAYWEPKIVADVVFNNWG